MPKILNKDELRERGWDEEDIPHESNLFLSFWVVANG